MVPGAELRARLAALPLLALAIPGQCSLVLPTHDLGPIETSAMVARREEPIEPPAIAAVREPPIEPPAIAARREPPIESSAITAKREEPVERVPIAPTAQPPVRAITLPEEVVVKAMGVGQPFFLRCWQRTLQREPGPIASKVRLHLIVDESGRVAAAHSDSESAELSRCLSLVARRLPFPAPGRQATVDLPLMFR